MADTTQVCLSLGGVREHLDKREDNNASSDGNGNLYMHERTWLLPRLPYGKKETRMRRAVLGKFRQQGRKEQPISRAVSRRHHGMSQ